MTRTIHASVIGEVMFDGPLTRVADALVARGGEFVAPSTIEAELMSIAVRRTRRGGIAPETARKRWLTGASTPVRRVPLGRYAEIAFSIACRIDHPVYDCLYLAVAIVENAPLVTADRRLYERAVENGLGAHVQWLGDCE